MTGLTEPPSRRCDAGPAPRRIDLRSDTVTMPTAAMYERMRTAALGDDGLDGDPTARELEALLARQLGKEAGLYLPTATMGNLLAVLAQADRQGQVLMEASTHMFVSERAGATLGGLTYLAIPGAGGEMDLDVLRQTLRRPGALRTQLVCMETSHANAGGAVLSLRHMQALRELAHAAGARVHVDGARLFNAAVALGAPADALACHADTVTVCLSKGLSAPAGAVLAGPLATIDRARQLRKVLGGTQRQIGVLAAAGLEAVESMVDRLAQDHVQAQRLGRALGDIRAGVLRTNRPATNIVLVDVPSTGPDSRAWARQLERCGVLARPWGEHRLRLVTHRHIESSDVDAAVSAFRTTADELLASSPHG